jgi:hypothetical protein
MTRTINTKRITENIEGHDKTHSSSASVNKSRFEAEAGGALWGNRFLLNRGLNRFIAEAISSGTNAIVCFLVLSTSAAAIVFFILGDEQCALACSQANFGLSLDCNRNAKRGALE